MGILNGGISGLFGSVFSSFYLDGTLVRASTIAGDGEGGNVVTEAMPQACKVQIDAVTEAMRQAPGYTENDVRLLVLQSGVTGGAIDSDCKVTVNGVQYLIGPVSQDPGASYWECRGTPA